MVLIASRRRAGKSRGSRKARTGWLTHFQSIDHCVSTGMFLRVDAIRNCTPLTLFQTEFACQLLSLGALTFTKLSILLFYHRIFRNQIFHKLIWVLGVMVVVWGISFFFATLFECYPISQVWTTFYGQPRKCYDYLPMFFATVITNMIMDIMILTIPWPRYGSYRCLYGKRLLLLEFSF